MSFPVVLFHYVYFGIQLKLISIYYCPKSAGLEPTDSTSWASIQLIKTILLFCYRTVQSVSFVYMSIAVGNPAICRERIGTISWYNLSNEVLGFHLQIYYFVFIDRWIIILLIFVVLLKLRLCIK